jgi:hypothetical protein
LTPRDGLWLGVDPGRSGAAAVVRVAAGQARVVAGASWRPSAAKGWDYLVDVVSRGGRVVTHRAPDQRKAWLFVQDHLGALLPTVVDGVAVEGLFTSPRALHGVLTLAEHAGRWLGYLEGVGVREGQVARPQARAWRSQLLGLPGNVKAKEADVVVAEWARTLPGGEVWGGMPHAHDAVAMAVWCAVYGEVGDGR